jgi:hypothetical protein
LDVFFLLQKVPPLTPANSHKQTNKQTTNQPINQSNKVRMVLYDGSSFDFIRWEPDVMWRPTQSSASSHRSHSELENTLLPPSCFPEHVEGVRVCCHYVLIWIFFLSLPYQYTAPHPPKKAPRIVGIIKSKS